MPEQRSPIDSHLRRRLTRRAALSSAGAGVIGALIQVDHAQGKRSRIRKVTKQFRQFTPITIPSAGAADPYPSVVRVSGFSASARITNLTVTLHDLVHPFPNHLDILLQAPSGERCVVVSDAGGVMSGPHTLTFDDAATQVIGPGGAVTGGTYRPVNHGDLSDFGAPESVLLARFDGIKPNGNWLLYVFDDSQGGAGYMTNGWSLRITAKQRR